jgi:predicted neutral ceramidase superfamily lipid hydrolase
MATSSQSPKLSDGWIPYLALAFFSTVIVAELLMDSFTAGGKYQVRNLVGFVFLGLLAYFFSKTEKKLAQEYLLPMLLVAVLLIIMLTKLEAWRFIF